VGRGRLVIAVIAAAALYAVPGASADIIAAVDVPLAGGASTGVNQHTDQFDIALLNATTGAKFSLPAGVNTSTADEFHPSITPNGKWLAFERADANAGTTRIIAANLSTGQTADLFNAFEIGTLKPATPFVEANGGAVLTGSPFSLKPQWTQTSLSAFPNPPFTRTSTQLPIVEQMNGHTFDPVDTSFASAATVVNESNGSEAVVVHREFANGDSDTVFISKGFDSSANIGFAHPTISDQTQNVEVMERRSQGGCVAVSQCAVLGQLGFLPGGVAARPTPLPAIINAPGRDQAFPAFTPDGRYLGFVRQTADNHDRLFVFDTVTQTLLNDQGVDLGLLGAPFSARDHLRRLEGNLSLRQTVVLTPSFQLASTGLLQFRLLSSSGVGLLVQRVVGHHKLLGHKVRTLKTIGRVPLGRFRRGRHKLHWNLRVAGHRLKPGTYLVTPRSVTPRRIVTGLGTPHVLKIRR
jgi:hypothetical protein